MIKTIAPRVSRESLMRLSIPLAALVLVLSSISLQAANNFVEVRLPRNLTVELPRNWTVLSKNQRITLDSFAQTLAEQAGRPMSNSDLSFAANHYDDRGKTIVIFNVRYYPDQTITQEDSRVAGSSDLKELDEALRNNLIPAMNSAGMKVLTWAGTTKKTINGIVTFITDYRRANAFEGAAFRVRLVRVLSGNRSFTVTISYREDLDILLRPICDRVIQSIRM